MWQETRARPTVAAMSLSYRYSLDHDELFDVVRREFGRWVAYELAHGGPTELRADYRINELVERYTPSSPRQLLELAMQCEALTDIPLEDPIFGHRPDDAYDALRIAVARSLSNDLWSLAPSAGLAPPPLDLRRLA
jgi:hypothetical protein